MSSGPQAGGYNLGYKFTKFVIFYILDGLPAYWDAQPRNRGVHLVTLLPSFSEYQEILTHFQTNFRQGKVPVVTKIQRIQNPGLFGRYLATKNSMRGKQNEMRLFHGTNVKNIPAINENNFNRSYAGINGRFYADVQACTSL
jgi:hypothetical protein